jgi:hypothetical protein
MVLDFVALDPNPARDKRVRLPKERKPHIPPPLHTQSRLGQRSGVHTEADRCENDRK